jgi:hypothetical protein
MLFVFSFFPALKNIGEQREFVIENYTWRYMKETNLVLVI